jgi:hypothetical protein
MLVYNVKLVSIDSCVLLAHLTNKRVLIWWFTLVLIKINYGQIGDQTGLFCTTNPVFYTGQSVRWKPMFFLTETIFTGFNSFIVSFIVPPCFDEVQGH